MDTTKRILEFNVNRQIIRKSPHCDFSDLVAGTVGYLHAKFNFGHDEWMDCAKAASFWVGAKEYPVLLDADGVCPIPPEVTHMRVFEVSLTGIKSNYTINTDRYLVRQKPDRR